MAPIMRATSAWRKLRIILNNASEAGEQTEGRTGLYLSPSISFAHHHTAGTGPVYQGRFKSFPVQDDEHFLTVARYVERNALQAGLAQHDRAERWRWSSLWLRDRRNARQLTPIEAELNASHSVWPVSRPRNWLRFVNHAQTARELEALRRSVRRGSPFGSEGWSARTVKRLALQSTVRPRGRHRRIITHPDTFVPTETPQANLAAGMQYLNGSYSSYFNGRHRRVGHLLQGRGKAQVIEEQGYCLAVSRCIHLNPVRARLVDKPERWRWRSYPGYHWRNSTLNWVTYADVLADFGSEQRPARAAYRRFVREGLGRQIDSPFNEAAHGLILGSAAFVQRLHALLDARPEQPEIPQLRALRAGPALAQVVATVSAEFEVDPARWRPGRRSDDIGRAVAAYLGRRVYGYAAGDVAEALGYASAAGVSQAIHRVESAGAHVARRLRALEGALTND